MYPIAHEIVVWMIWRFVEAYTYIWKQFLPWHCKTLAGPGLLPDLYGTNGTYVRWCSSSSVAIQSGTALLRRRRRTDPHGTPLIAFGSTKCSTRGWWSWYVHVLVGTLCIQGSRKHCFLCYRKSIELLKGIY